LLTERIDLELNAICNAYRNRRFCLLDTLRLVERDWDGTRTIIAKDVHERVLLAHAIVIQELPRGLLPRRVWRGWHQGREQREHARRGAPLGRRPRLDPALLPCSRAR